MTDQMPPTEAVITTEFDQFHVFAVISWIEANNYDPFVHIVTKYPGVRLPASEMAKPTSVINLAGHACGKMRWLDDHIEVAQRFNGQSFVCLIPYRSIALAMFRGTQSANVMPWAIALPGGGLAVAVPQVEDTAPKPGIGLVVGMDSGKDGGDQSVGPPAPVSEALKALDTSKADVGRGLDTPVVYTDDPPTRMRGHLRVVK